MTLVKGLSSRSIRVSKLLLFTILLLGMAPLVNNFNGFTYLVYNISIIGPLYYTVIFFLCLDIMVTARGQLESSRRSWLVLLALTIYGLCCVASGKWVLSDFPQVIKGISPILIYLALKVLTQGQLLPRAVELIRNWLILCAFGYGCFVILSFLLHKNLTAGQGYYGFVGANNDLVEMFMLCIPVMVEGWQLAGGSEKRKRFVYYFALFLTRSKALIAAPLLLLSTKKWRFIIPLFLVTGLFAYYAFAYYTAIFRGYGLEPSWDNILTFASFGRSTFLFLVIDNLGHRSLWDSLIGSGFAGAALNLGGKVGVEMDPIDAINMFGLVGAAFYAYFYIWLSFSAPIRGRTRLLLLPMVLYSFFGGHLLMNPISNTVYPFVLFLLRNGKRAKELSGSCLSASQSSF